MSETELSLLAPLSGTWRLFAVGRFADGTEVRSVPLDTLIEWPADAPTVNPQLGPAMASVRYFDPVNVSGFDWDTALPVAEILNHGTSGSMVITSSGVIELEDLELTNPGVEVDYWYYAAVEDWYEFKFSGSLEVNGRSVPILNGMRMPVNLAVGWHRIRHRATFSTVVLAGSNRVEVRGGTSQSFVQLERALAANVVDGGGAQVPEILGVTIQTGSATTRTLQVNATVGDGGEAALAALTYHWSLPVHPLMETQFGPSNTSFPERFSPNRSGDADSTTLTLFAPGQYEAVLQVSGPDGSALTTIPIDVPVVPTSFVITAATPREALRGMSYPISAVTRDQFNRRIEIVPDEAGAPTVAWSTNDPEGTVTVLSEDGEVANYRSFSATGDSSQSFTVTATGINGRTGTATSPSITIFPNQPPEVQFSPPLIRMSQAVSDGTITFSSFVRDPESLERLDPVVLSGRSFSFHRWNSNLLTYEWRIVSAPEGQHVKLTSPGFSRTGVIPTGPGLYQVELSAIDQAGETLSDFRSFTIDETGKLFTLDPLNPISDISAFVGEDAIFYNQTYFSHLSEISGSWQRSQNEGLDWEDIPVSGFADINSLLLPSIQLSDDGTWFRQKISAPTGIVFSDPAVLSVLEPVGGLIRFAGNQSNLVSVEEDAGSVDFVVQRLGESSGAASVKFVINSFGSSSFAAILGTHYLGIDVDGTPQTEVIVEWPAGDKSERVLSLLILDTDTMDVDKYLSVELTEISGAKLASDSSRTVVIRNKDWPGRAHFLPADQQPEGLRFKESDGFAIVLVERSGRTRGNLAVEYQTVEGSALEGRDFVSSQGSLIWEDGDDAIKEIQVPLLQTDIVQGTRSFLVRLESDNDQMLLSTGTWREQTVFIENAPFKDWQKQWWPKAIPPVTEYSGFTAALEALDAKVHLPFSETSGSSVAGVNSGGDFIFSANILAQGSGGAYDLDQPGPGSPEWPGLDDFNSALSLTAAGSVSNPSGYSAGHFIQLGTNAIAAAELGQGFTISAFVKTPVDDRVMTLIGGADRDIKDNLLTLLQVTLNQAARSTGSVSPHHLRIALRSLSGRTMDYSVPLAGLPSGSLADGQWHHIAIVVPPFTAPNNADFPRFYFDGKEVGKLTIWGNESITDSDVFLDFTSGLRLGADESATPTRFFNGSIDEFAYFSKVLSAGQISALAQARPLEPPPAALAPMSVNSSDGLPNVLKYAWGMDPRLPASSADLPRSFLEGGDFGFEFTRMRDATDIAYILEHSPDLSVNSWLPAWSSLEHSYPGSLPSVRESIMIDRQDHPRMFFRLRVQPIE